MEIGRQAVRLRVIVTLLVAAVVLAPGAVSAKAKLINPCNYTDFDTPCRIQDGEYRALIPQNPGPHPAVIYLYGSLGLSRQITDARYFREEVVRRGYALIVPSALDITYVGNLVGTGWGRRIRAHRHPRDDLDFLRRVLRDAELRHNIDLDRLIWAGQSDGGFMIWEIACHHPEMGVAFAVHAASYGGRLPRRCRRPVRLLHAHGTADDVVPFEGERAVGGVVDSADVGEALELMARTNRCRSEAETASRYHGFERRSWEGCAEGSALDLLVHRGGHGWPRSWMPAVLDWFDATSWRPPVSRTMRVGEDAPAGFRRPSGGGLGGRFISVPK